MNRNPSSSGTTPSSGVEISLRVLILQRGRALEVLGDLSLHEVDGACFGLQGKDQRVLGPFAGVDDLFRRLGRRLFCHAGGCVYELEGWVLSVDSDGCVGGPYPDFDEWVWTEGETVSRERARASGMGFRWVHRWQGLFFLTVDPLPSSPVSFPSAESARAHGRSMAPPLTFPRSE
ncbi:MAG: hypothetical protein P8188_05410 [Gemmatimonadota bacterium]